jgi:hypothetical protein
MKVSGFLAPEMSGFGLTISEYLAVVAVGMWKVTLLLSETFPSRCGK